MRLVAPRSPMMPGAGVAGKHRRRPDPTRLRPAGIALLLAATIAGQPAWAQERSDPALDPDCLRVLAGVDLQVATVLDLQAAMDAGRFTSEQLTARYLQRITTFDGAVELPTLEAETAAEPEHSPPWLNSVRSLAADAEAQAQALDRERATDGSRGPLHGVAVLLKDNVGTSDLPTTAGSIALAANLPAADATITQAFRDAGAIVLGKANLSEFANWTALGMPNGYSSLGGQVIAPYSFGQDPSGSSTGSGVAATMAFATVAIGTETSGSIISPATAHSLVGVKPTLGLVSRAGIIPLAPSFDTPGPMTRTVTDAAAVLDAIAGVDPADPATDALAEAGADPAFLAELSDVALEGARIGVRAGDADDDGLFGAALRVLREQGAEVVVIDEPLPQAANLSLLELGAIPNEFKLTLNRYLASEAGPEVPVATLGEIIAFNEQRPGRLPYGQNLLEASDAQTGSEFDPAYLAAREGAITAARTWIDGVVAAYELEAIVGPNSANTSVTAAAGYPNVTVPMGYGGTPAGVAFAGPAFADAELLAYAFDFEQATLARVPPTQRNRALQVDCPTAAGAGTTSGATPEATAEATASPALTPTTGGGAGGALGAILAAVVLSRRWRRDAGAAPNRSAAARPARTRSRHRSSAAG